MTLPALVAPDSFKGTFTASEVAAAIAAGLRAGEREAVELPVADGGEGTMDVLVDTLGGEYRTATVSDPLGRPIEARFGLLPDGRAVVETAQASGLALLTEDERDPWAASTRGTGELIVALDSPEAFSMIYLVPLVASTAAPSRSELAQRVVASCGARAVMSLRGSNATQMKPYAATTIGARVFPPHTVAGVDLSQVNAAIEVPTPSIGLEVEGTSST